MKAKYPLTKEEKALVSVHTNIAPRNIQDTYICKDYNHDTLEVMLFGSMLKEAGLKTKEAVKMAIDHAKITEDYDGK